jgi:Flagellar hook-length control protein FliK
MMSSSLSIQPGAKESSQSPPVAGNFPASDQGDGFPFPDLLTMLAQSAGSPPTTADVVSDLQGSAPENVSLHSRSVKHAGLNTTKSDTDSDLPTVASLAREYALHYRSPAGNQQRVRQPHDSLQPMLAFPLPIIITSLPTVSGSAKTGRGTDSADSIDSRLRVTDLSSMAGSPVMASVSDTLATAKKMDAPGISSTNEATAQSSSISSSIASLPATAADDMGAKQAAIISSFPPQLSPMLQSSSSSQPNNQFPITPAMPDIRDMSSIASHADTGTDNGGQPNALVWQVNGVSASDIKAKHSNVDSSQSTPFAVSTTGTAPSSNSTISGTGSTSTVPSSIEQMTNQVTAQAQLIQNGQSAEMRLRLRPPDLGDVQITLRRDAEGVLSAHLVPVQHDATLLLTQHISHLQQALDQHSHGGHAEVSIGQQETGDRQSRRQGQQWTGAASSSWESDDTDSSTTSLARASPISGRSRATQSLVDYNA